MLFFAFVFSLNAKLQKLPEHQNIDKLISDQPLKALSFKTKDPPLLDKHEENFENFLTQNSNPFIRNEKSLCENANSDFLYLFRSSINNIREELPNIHGPLGTGLCWWLSDFQFNFLFLTYINPQGEKPSREEKEKIIQKITQGEEVSELSGYPSLLDFLKDPEVKAIIYSQISNKFLMDTFLNFRWAKTKVHDHKKTQPSDYEAIKKLIEEEKLPAPLFISFPGVSTHSLIGLRIPTYDQSSQSRSYIVTLDSNPIPSHLEYQPLQQSFNTTVYHFEKNFKPKTKKSTVYIDKPERYKTIKSALDNFCLKRGKKRPAALRVPEWLTD